MSTKFLSIVIITAIMALSGCSGTTQVIDPIVGTWTGNLVDVTVTQIYYVDGTWSQSSTVIPTRIIMSINGTWQKVADDRYQVTYYDTQGTVQNLHYILNKANNTIYVEGSPQEKYVKK